MKRLWRSRWTWILLSIILVFILAWCGYRYLTSPRFVKRMVLRDAPKFLRGDLSIDDARIELLRGLEISGMRIVLDEASPPDVTVEHVQLDWNPVALLYAEVEPRRVVFVRPSVRVVPSGKSVNLARLIRRRKRRPPTQRRSMARPFSDGLFIESGRVAWIAPKIFGDERPRVFDGVDVEMQRSSETFGRWQFNGLLREPPLDGVRIEGWMDLAAGDRSVSIHARGDELPIGPDLLAFLPEKVQRRISRFALSGFTDLDLRFDYRTGRPLNFALEFAVHNVEARIRASDLRVSAVDARVRLDRGGFSVDGLSGILWDGMLQAGALGRAGSECKMWLNIEKADLARIATDLALDKTDLRGWMDATVKFRFDAAAPQNWTAEGSLTFSDARLARLPVLGKVFAALHLRLPRDEVFDEGKCHFTVRDGKVHVENLVISSPSVDVTASGEIGLDGQVDLLVLIAGAEREDDLFITQPIRFVIRGLEREVMPPVRVRGMPPDSLEIRVLAMEPIKRQFRRLRDLLPFIGPSSRESKEK